MKSIFSLVVLCSLFSASAFAEDFVSLDYSCKKNGEEKTGTVSIDNSSIVGKESCMKFSLFNRKLCWRLERPSNIYTVSLSLRAKSDLDDGLAENFIYQTSAAPAEVGSIVIPVKFGFSKKNIECSFSKVNWPTSQQ